MLVHNTSQFDVMKMFVKVEKRRLCVHCNICVHSNMFAQRLQKTPLMALSNVSKDLFRSFRASISMQPSNLVYVVLNAC